MTSFFQRKRAISQSLGFGLFQPVPFLVQNGVFSELNSLGNALFPRAAEKKLGEKVEVLPQIVIYKPPFIPKNASPVGFIKK